MSFFPHWNTNGEHLNPFYDINMVPFHLFGSFKASLPFIVIAWKIALKTVFKCSFLCHTGLK